MKYFCGFPSVPQTTVTLPLPHFQPDIPEPKLENLKQAAWTCFIFHPGLLWTHAGGHNATIASKLF